MAKEKTAALERAKKASVTEKATRSRRRFCTEIGVSGIKLRLRMEGLAALAREMATDIGAAA